MSTVSSIVPATATTASVEHQKTVKEDSPSRCERITSSVLCAGNLLYQGGEKVACYTILSCCSLIARCFDLMDQRKSLQHIHDFWKKKIASQTIYHVTSTLFSQHYKKNGLTAPLPAPFVEDMEALQAIWVKYAKELPAALKPYYPPFADFCSALQAKHRPLTWTVDKQGKPEWQTSLCLLVEAAERLEKKFTKEEHYTVSKLRELSYLLTKMPEMTFSRPLTDAHASTHYYYEALSFRIFRMSEARFTHHIQDSCQQWARPGKLKKYLAAHIEPEIEQGVQLLRRQGLYLDNPTKIEEVTMLQSKKRSVRSEDPVQFLATDVKLKLNTPCEISAEELESLKLHKSGFSLHSYFSGEKFECKPVQSSHLFRVTRRVQTTQEAALYTRWKASLETQSKIRTRWLKLFNCESVAYQYGIRASELYNDNFIDLAGF